MTTTAPAELIHESPRPPLRLPPAARPSSPPNPTQNIAQATTLSVRIIAVAGRVAEASQQFAELIAVLVAGNGQETKQRSLKAF